MNILILDIVHGGEILAQEYSKRGCSVDCVDVYGKAKEDIMSDLREYGISVHDKMPKGHFDLLLMPVHCPDMFLNDVTYDERRTFHEAVGGFIDGGSRIEVTGVKGKTSCCYLLAHILSIDGRSIFLHTSRGQGEWKGGTHTIEKRVSIAPTSLLKLPKGHDAVIAEVSLGGSGKAEMAIITNLAEDYRIAANTRKASDAKASIFSDGKNIVPRSESHIWSKYRDGLIYFGGRVSVVSGPEIGKPTKIKVNYDGEHELFLHGSYLHLQYLDTIEAVLEACYELRVPAEQAIRGLETFNGVPGRGEVKRTEIGWEITERNPGISRMSVAKTLDILGYMGLLKDTIVMLEPMSRNVCEKMDVREIKEMVEDKGAEFCLDDGADTPKEKRVILRIIKEGYQ
ncbi:Mur ligase middle domain protein [Candidatus Methanoplasma termitum]|uniref:Mur ligase middle domain protein n=1 Tax=Candidatus Methanoplasma termitum TaxID=1577791 RepID=A0A0A7LC93_9ARCH|nr:coenzyme F430 synthase [Candidatus Methanoplasma termitum]AIZ56684.1 Mur ligase middle domain protein [Candidatus Methanoplasma termitum]MCL2333328.1 coenzyme F430 synthase [Candidatus Methanoplasma sp.]